MVDIMHSSTASCPVLYPLDPLTAREITEVTRLIREKEELLPRFRFISVFMRGW
jgi:Cu2+-containing amine oxidase